MSQFVIGPSFAEQELAGISFMLTSFPDMADAVLNGLLACSGRFFALLEEDNRSKKEDRNEDYRYSAKAVKELRKRGETKANASPRGMADLTLAMSLALGIITFDLLDSGLHAHSICRYALGLISSGTYSEAVTRGGRLGRQMLPLIHMDTCNCLVRREIPMYRLQSGGGGKRGSDGVDRYIGRCVSLFSILYDVCCVNQKLKLGSREGHDIARRQENFEELAQVEATVRDWSAELNEEDTTRLTPREIEVITTQASVHRKAILLFIYRLRFPFGTEDDAATHMATVLDDIANLYCCSGGSGGSGEGEDSMPFEYRMALPFLIAVAELQDPVQKARALKLLDLIMWKRMYYKAGGLLARFIFHVWEARDHGWSGQWVDLTEDGPPFVLF